MIFSISTAAIAAASILLTSSFSTVDATVSLQQATFQGCYSSVYPMVSNGSYQYQTSGYCQQQCGGLAEKAAFALYQGSDCYCGDKFPPESTKVDDDECNRPCQGFGTEMCGGMSTYSVYNSGLLTSVESASDDEASSAATTSAGATTTKARTTQTATQSPSVITQAGTTIIITPTAAAAAATSSSSSTPGSSGPSKAGIAAGVVVGILAVAGLTGGAYFFVRNRKRRAIEEEHQRQQSINNFANSIGTIKSEGSSADARLDPTMMYRRQSDGSIADERDLSARVLKVTNPDRNTMIA